MQLWFCSLQLDTSEIPRWLLALLREKFFNGCIIHEDSKKNEKNVFCLDCCEGICSHCFVHHPSHRLFQIRRYVYHNVIRLGDADKLMDCAQVQSYTTNNSKVVFLRERAQSRPGRGGGNLCISCDRNLQDSFLFCSLSCKLQHVLNSGCKVSDYLRKCEFLALPEPAFDEGQRTPDSVLEATGPGSSDSGSDYVGPSSLVGCPALTSTATTEVVRTKRSNLAGFRSDFNLGCEPVKEVSEVTLSRRKGTPHRSPFY
ncbi:protein RGF1 INDUCIBLE TRANSCRIPTION FACTOR 1-like isoform X1 [Primulina huaijiensis]|uniref:protein RGF1 INDUCIBLE TRANSCRIPTION FACTOR 1-like isoform X1 n=1 Tax=Primulina huaijiensis TaxID=1492673 RepID=UPI003CC7310C